jgi:hypothetical protein
MKKSHIISVFVLVLALNLFLTSCLFKKKADNKPKSPIEQVTLACFVKDEKIYWIFTERNRLECPNWSNPFIVEDSLALKILWRLDYVGLAKAQIFVDYPKEALYFERCNDMKMIETDVVYVSYGEKGVVRYGMINEKLYVKKFTANELISIFPKDVRDTMANLGIYILNK